jgi:hypothetical protein
MNKKYLLLILSLGNLVLAVPSIAEGSASNPFDADVQNIQQLKSKLLSEVGGGKNYQPSQPNGSAQQYGAVLSNHGISIQPYRLVQAPHPRSRATFRNSSGFQK